MCVGGSRGSKGILTRLEIGTINFTLVHILHFIFLCLQNSSFFLLIAMPKHKANTHFNILLISPPQGVSAADRGPVDNTCSAECSIGGWSGCAGSGVVTVLLRSHLHCGPLSTGNHTTDSYNWSRLLLNHCCLGLLGSRKQSKGLLHKTARVLEKKNTAISEIQKGVNCIKENKHGRSGSITALETIKKKGSSNIVALVTANKWRPAVSEFLGRAKSSSIIVLKEVKNIILLFNFVTLDH